MSDKKAKVSEKKGNIDMPSLTDRDMELLISALRCVDGGFPKTDLQKFATMAGFKNPASAGVSLNILKKKVMGDAGSTKSTPKKAAPKKATPSKRKQAATDSENGDGDEPGESATKKQKMTPKKAGKKEADPQPEGGDDEGTAFL